MLEFCDSFDHYTNAELGLKWSSFTTLGGFGIYANRGRFGTQGYMYGGSRELVKIIGSKQERIVGQAVLFGGADLFNSNREVVRFIDGVSPQVELRTSGGVLQATLGASTLIPGAVGTTQLVGSVFYYIEIRLKHHNTLGTLEVRLNGNVEFALTGIDTQASANASSDTLAYGQAPGGGSAYLLDDVYICDTVDSGVSGAPNNDFLGDVRVEALMPSGNGATSNFDGSDGNSTDNYLLVDEIPPNGDTDYVESGDIGDKDTYAYPDLASAAGTVKGIQRIVHAKKTNAGPRKLKFVSRLSGGTEADSLEYVMSTNYLYMRDVAEAKPGGGQWTISDVNGAEFGQKVA